MMENERMVAERVTIRIHAQGRVTCRHPATRTTRRGYTHVHLSRPRQPLDQVFYQFSFIKLKLDLGLLVVAGHFP